MQSEKIKSEFVIHWGDIFRHILKWWWIVVASLVLGGIVGILFGHFTYTPVYETQAVYLVSYSGRAGDSMGDISSEYSLVQRVLNNCIVIAKQNKFMYVLEEKVNEGVEKNSEAYISAQQLRAVISYSNAVNGSSATGTTLTVSVQSNSADKSLKITETLTEIFSDYITDNYQLAEGESLIFSLINTPEKAVRPMTGSKRVLYGALMGIAFAVLSVAALFFIALFDNRIKTESDIEDRYDIPVLGVIPRYEDIISIKGDKRHENA